MLASKQFNTCQKIMKTSHYPKIGEFKNDSFLQGDPNQNPLFQMALRLNWSMSDPMLVKPKLVWEAVVFFQYQLIFAIFNLSIWIMALLNIERCGLMVKALDCHAKGPWFKSHQGHKNSFLLQKLYNFFYFFKNLIFVTKNYRLSNQFWLYKHGVRNAPFQTQSHLK